MRGGLLPEGGHASSNKEYFDAWEKFMSPLADALDIQPHGFDPTVSYRTSDGEQVQLPRWFIRRFNEYVLRRDTQ